MKKLRTSEETAVILAALLKKAEVTRARISDKTIKLVSGRSRLEESFRVNLNNDISEYDYIIIRLGSGGQAAIKISSLEAAKTVTAKRVLSNAEIQSLTKGNPDIDAYRKFIEDGEEHEDINE